jgi:hypothetical protein
MSLATPTPTHPDRPQAEVKPDHPIHVEQHPADEPTSDYKLSDGSKATQYADAQLKSDLDTLSTWKAIKTFRRAFVVCAIGAFSSVTDGACWAAHANYGFTRPRC